MSARQASLLSIGRADFVRDIKNGSMPGFDKVFSLLNVLGVRVHVAIGPTSRSPDSPLEASAEGLNASPENLRLDPPDGETGLLTPAHLPELERSAHTLARLVAEAGGDPIPEDLRPAGPIPDGLQLVSAEDLDGDPPPGARQIEVRELAAAAGGGALELDEAVTGHLAFQRTWLERHGIDPTRCTVIGVKGESMEPTLPDGCSILVDRSRRRRLVGRIYVVRSPDEGIVVKRLAKDDGGGWLLGSDHPAWKPVPWPDGADIIGAVRWFAKMLR